MPTQRMKLVSRRSTLVRFAGRLAPVALLSVLAVATAAQARKPPCPPTVDCDKWNELWKDDCDGLGECMDKLANRAAAQVRDQMNKLRQDLEGQRDKAQKDAANAQRALDAAREEADRNGDRVVEEATSKLRAEVESTKKKLAEAQRAAASGLKNAWGASQEAAALALCFKNNQPAWLAKIDPAAYAKDPSLLFNAVLQQLQETQRATLREARKSLAGTARVAFAADDSGARFELKLGLPRVDAGQQLKLLLEEMKRTAQRQGDKAVQNCLIPHLQKNLPRLQAASQGAADHAQKVFTDNVEPLLPVIAAKGIELGLDKMATLLGDKDLVTMMRAIIAEALLDPRHVEEMAARLDEVNAALKSNSPQLTAKAGVAQRTISAQWEPTTETLYLLAVPAVASGAKWAANKAVANTMPIAYDGSVKLLNLGMKSVYFVAEEACSMGDVFVEWACSAATKVVAIVLEGAEVGGREAVEKLVIPVTNAMVNAVIDEVATQFAARGKAKVAHAADPKIRAILAMLPADKRQKLTLLIKNTMVQVAGPAVANMLHAMKHYNGSVAALVGAQKPGVAGAASPGRVSTKPAANKPAATKPGKR